MTRALPHHSALTPHPPRSSGRPLGDRLRGLLSMLVLLALLVGVPAALVALRGNPLPDAGLNRAALLDVLTRPDDGSLFLAALTWVAWLGWASFALSVCVEVPALLRGLPSPRLPALGLQQHVASSLVAGAALLFTVPLTALSNPALAAPTPAPSATAPTAASLTSAGAPAPPSAAAAATTTAPQTVRRPAPAPRYTVQAGDSLWQIAADQLGDGARYLEIARLNYGAPQPDGLALTADHWLRPGWTLTLPADAADTPAASPAEASTVVVTPGDTLWDIAQQTLGDGSRHGEIAAASTGLQPDGDRLTDPDLIRPGWRLTVPAAPPRLPQQLPPPATEAADTRGSDWPASPPSDAHAPAPAATAPTQEDVSSPASPADGPTDQDVNQLDVGDEDEDEESVAVRTAAGVGALLAAGLLVLLGAKRARQQRRRRPGQRIPMPPPDLAPAELDLRLVEDPAGLARVDQALRTLSVLLAETGRPLPTLRLARLHSQQLELYLAEPATLPAPFIGTGDPTVWTLEVDAPLLPAAELAAVPAPYPSLVTLGHDLDDAHVLLDLEHAGTLAVDGDAHGSVAVLAALAAELATSSWADDLQVTLVGCLPTLPAALGTGRVRYLPSLDELLPTLEHRSADVSAALASHQLADLQQARTAAPDGALPRDAWTPEIVLLAGAVDPVARARLDAVLQHLPGVGVAVVTTAEPGLSEWRLHLAADASTEAVAVLAPVNLALRPQVLTAADLDQLLGLLAVADEPPNGSAPGDDSESNEPAVTDLGSHLSVHDGRAGAVPAPSPQPIVVRPVDPHAVPVAGAPRAGGAAQTRDDDVALTDESVVLDEQPAPLARPAPLIQVLGPVDVRHPRGTVEPSKRRQLTEIAAFLALHPGADHHGLSEAIWPGACAVDNTRNTALSKLRRWLGAADDGSDYVPRVIDDGYRLRPEVRTDWQLWQELLPDGPARASTEDLAAALELVHGKPFAGTNPRRYAWAERNRQDMLSAIVDVAHELARRALLEGNAPLARRAAAAGLQADPGAELLWRDALKAEWLAGDRHGLVSTADRLSALADELGDDLEPETVALLDELLRRPTTQAQAR